MSFFMIKNYYSDLVKDNIKEGGYYNQLIQPRCNNSTKSLLNKDILLIIQCNYAIPESRISAIYFAWKCSIENVVIYGPWNKTIASRLQKQGLPILTTIENDVNFGDTGVWSYRASLHAIGIFESEAKYKGFLFVHDDLVVRSSIIKALDRDSIWFADQSWKSLLEPWYLRNHSWPYFNNNNFGIERMQRILKSNKKIRNVLRNCTGNTHEWFHGQSDFFYIPAIAARSFLDVVGIFSSEKLTVEIALPTYVNCFAPKHVPLVTLKLCTFWEKERGNLTHYQRNCDSSYALVHPLKMLSVNHYQYMKTILYS
jgi:hypothetical protein